MTIAAGYQDWISGFGSAAREALQFPEVFARLRSGAAAGRFSSSEELLSAVKIVFRHRTDIEVHGSSGLVLMHVVRASSC